MKYLFTLLTAAILSATFSVLFSSCGLDGDIESFVSAGDEPISTPTSYVGEQPKEEGPTLEPIPGGYTLHLVSGANQCVGPGEYLEAMKWRLETDTGEPVAGEPVIFDSSASILLDDSAGTLFKETNEDGEVFTTASVPLLDNNRVRKPAYVWANAFNAHIETGFTIQPPTIVFEQPQVIGRNVGDLVFEYEYAVTVTEPCGRPGRHRRLELTWSKWTPGKGHFDESRLSPVYTDANGWASFRLRLPTISTESGAWVNVITLRIPEAHPVSAIGCWWAFDCDRYQSWR